MGTVKAFHCTDKQTDERREYGSSAHRLIETVDAELSGVDECYIDGIHFTEAGSQAAARVVSEAIAPLLQTASGAPAGG